MRTLDGADFPYIIKMEYTVDGQVYTKRKWINAGILISRSKQKSCNSNMGKRELRW